MELGVPREPAKSATSPPSQLCSQPRDGYLHPTAMCPAWITALLLPHTPAGGQSSPGGSFWGSEGAVGLRCAARGGLPEGCALPWSWRAARASRRCARRCAGCSAAAGTRGWPSRCSGPFGAHQTEIRTAGDPWPCPGRGDARGRGSPRSRRARAQRCHQGRARRVPPAFPERGTGRVPEPTQPGPGRPVPGQHSPGATGSCCCFPALPLLPAPGGARRASAPRGREMLGGLRAGRGAPCPRGGEVPEGMAAPGMWWQRRGGAHHPLAPLAPPQAHELLVLPGHEVDGGVLQQGGEDKEQADGHPDVNGLHVGDLRGDGG